MVGRFGQVGLALRGEGRRRGSRKGALSIPEFNVSENHFHFTEKWQIMLEMGQKSSPTNGEGTELRGKLYYSEHVETHKAVSGYETYDNGTNLKRRGRR